MDVNDTRRARSRGLRLLPGLVLGLQLAAVGGCGDGDDAGDAAAFIGTWHIIDGNAVACQLLTTPLGGAQVKMTAASDAPLQVDVRGCLMKFDITGNTAKARAGQTCRTTFEIAGMGNLEVDLSIAKAEFAVTGGTGVLTMEGTAMTPFLPGGGCPYQAMAMATKITP